jgi:hypothetical protein
MPKARRKSFGKSKIVPPQGRLRQSQVVTTFGPGSMVDLLDHAVLVGGLDFWSHQHGMARLENARLRDRLADMFKDAGLELAGHGAFVEPPAGNEQEFSAGQGVQVLEFPQWFVCQDCRALVRSDGLELKSGRYRHHCAHRTDKRGADCVPVRFVAACRKGHLSEFPWIPWVHEMQGEPRCAAPQLTLEEGETGDFSEVLVKCSCDLQRPLSQVLAPEARPRCSGERPWLGPNAREECDEKMKLLVRTASNGYFAQVVSALSIPEKGLELYEAVRNCWDVMANATRETLPAFRTIDRIKQAFETVSDDELLQEIQRVKDGKQPAREPIRTAEYKQFTSQPDERPGELPREDDAFFARRATLADPLPQGIGSIYLAKKLLELRVQVGFTRLEAATPDLQGEYDIGVQTQVLGLNRDWLPATEVRGEGILIVLDEEAVQAWERRPEVLARAKELLAGYDKWMETASYKPPFPGVRFYLLHTLSHLLISAVSLDCGYAASAIRERIYCSLQDEAEPMAAILLMTGSSGAEGTLGGLVEQGRRMREHLRHAYDLGVLCSNDPICAGHSPKGDRAERYLEGAACHGCLYVAECSCERFNRYLDRALAVPTIGRPRDLAFFSERP